MRRVDQFTVRFPQIKYEIKDIQNTYNTTKHIDLEGKVQWIIKMRR